MQINHGVKRILRRWAVSAKAIAENNAAFALTPPVGERGNILFASGEEESRSYLLSPHQRVST
jgi:hypothetical protein